METVPLIDLAESQIEEKQWSNYDGKKIIIIKNVADDILIFYIIFQR